MDSDWIIQNDCAEIAEGLAELETYSFAEELQSRMEALGLSSAALGVRCGLSHTIVDKWRKGTAKPNGRERIKELGLALEYNIQQIDNPTL